MISCAYHCLVLCNRCVVLCSVVMFQGEYLVLKKKDDSEVSFPDPDGLRNGIGLRVWANGNRYEGTFRDDVGHGEGSLQKFEGGKYSGDFRNGERHGMGLEVREQRREKKKKREGRFLKFVCRVSSHVFR